MTRAELYREYKAQGHTAKETAEHFGVSSDYIRKLCRGIAPQGQGPIDEQTVSERVKEKSLGQFEYVSGYTNKEKNILVRCTVCGGEFERTYHHLTTRLNNCPCCVERERLQLKEARDAEKERKRKEREAKAQERKEERIKRSEAWANRPYHNCAVCGTLTQNPKYCCKDCLNKAMQTTHEHRRRARLKAQMVDKDITIEGLFRRDKGVCSLCGGRCDLEDYTVREGVFIAGDWYPSVDHIKPISKGGLHSWGNVQLAHRRCNTLKSDNEFE